MKHRYYYNRKKDLMNRLKLAIIVIGIISPILIINKCRAQDKTFIGAGATYSTINGFESETKKSIGYYISASVLNPVSKCSAFGGDFQWISQKAGDDLNKFHVNTFNTSVFYNLQPTKLPLSLIGGIQIGFMISAKNPTDSENSKGPRFSTFGGLRYELKRYGIEARYNRIVNGSDFFDGIIQLGASYRLSK